jgi:hypothetical protein
MRLHVWDDDNVPTVHFDKYEGEGEIQLLDFPWWVGYEVGDQVQHVTEIGTSVYQVVDVEPEYAEYNSPPQARRVTLRAW